MAATYPARPRAPPLLPGAALASQAMSAVGRYRGAPARHRAQAPGASRRPPWQERCLARGYAESVSHQLALPCGCREPWTEREPSVDAPRLNFCRNQAPSRGWKMLPPRPGHRDARNANPAVGRGYVRSGAPPDGYACAARQAGKRASRSRNAGSSMDIGLYAAGRKRRAERAVSTRGFQPRVMTRACTTTLTASSRLGISYMVSSRIFSTMLCNPRAPVPRW